MKMLLQDELKGAFRSNNTDVRGSLDKTITILMKIWGRPPGNLLSLQREGLNLLSRLPCEDHIAIHWGMTMAVYPFWTAFAAHVGHLLRLQGTAGAHQVQRRLREEYGERKTVSRRVHYVLRSFVDWEVLKDMQKQGAYAPGKTCAIENQELIAWMAEAHLQAHPRGSLPPRATLDSTSLFPFRLRQISAEQLIAANGRLEAMRHGLDQDLIMLRKGTHSTTKGNTP